MQRFCWEHGSVNKALTSDSRGSEGPATRRALAVTVSRRSASHAGKIYIIFPCMSGIPPGTGPSSHSAGSIESLIDQISHREVVALEAGVLRGRAHVGRGFMVAADPSWLRSLVAGLAAIQRPLNGPRSLFTTSVARR